MEKLLSCGYAVIDIINNEEYFGGSAAGLGLKTGLCALFGDDPFSKKYWNFLVAEGVNMALSKIVQGSQIPVNRINQEDKNSGWNDFGISYQFDEINLNPSEIRSYGIIHLASAHPGLINKIIKGMGDSSYLSYSPGPKIRLNPQGYLNLNFFRKSHLLFLNEEEWRVIESYFNLNNEDDLLSLGPQIAAITLGPLGSIVVYYEGSSIVKQHIPVPEVKSGDTTGAGDAYALGFLIGLQHRLAPPQAAEIATALSLLAIEQRGVLIDKYYLRKFRNIFK
jgi:sugar/nucleoside kinase (ribokinase family)